ncbi:phage Gp37/Gp68 family protein [Roseospira marina]|uniref:Phage Gp37/Gp68 family protein n=1 Tax=Roseospira marina TaxID=140057 RepID=A0A5M6IAL7_9PROT|nr:phage Gp37/Gp68 family protein [Roseospira marina]KAA5604708.1 phage Gp37/Gp68 family protein [Roseospira marina]MBB4315156.1 protein gp37 [Roseospira marina]MBB5088074.1 protein gp37 [Roseospira marina]
MGENSRIEWTDHTWNPWIGCTKVSPACDHCYAEGVGRRLSVPWGHGQPRRRAAESTWRQPFAWDRKAKREGRRYRVFCASLADVFDAEVPDAWRDEMFAVMALTPHLDWIVVTKRPKVARDYLTLGRDAGNGVHMPPLWHIGMTQDDPSWPDTRDWPLPNVTLLASVETQAMADLRIPILLDTPAARRGLSVEPLLGPVDLTPWLGKLDWVICGGESGPYARPMHPDWARSLRDQCAAAGVPFFFKQWGEWRPPLHGEPYDTSRGRMQRTPAFIVAHDGSVHCFQPDHIVNGRTMVRVGKHAAGRLLDNLEYDGQPI